MSAHLLGDVIQGVQHRTVTGIWTCEPHIMAYPRYSQPHRNGVLRAPHTTCSAIRTPISLPIRATRPGTGGSRARTCSVLQGTRPPTPPASRPRHGQPRGRRHSGHSGLILPGTFCSAPTDGNAVGGCSVSVTALQRSAGITSGPHTRIMSPPTTTVAEQPRQMPRSAIAARGVHTGTHRGRVVAPTEQSS